MRTRHYPVSRRGVGVVQGIPGTMQGHAGTTSLSHRCTVVDRYGAGLKILCVHLHVEYHIYLNHML